MCALSKGMDTGISPSGAMHSNGRACDLPEYAFQMILDRVSMLLALPTGKVTTVVRNDQPEPLRHRGGLTTFVALRSNRQAIEIGLQDDLGCDLVYVAASVTSFLPGIA